MNTLRIALWATVIGLASASMSQTTPGDMKVDVPFSFVVAGQTMPAGPYVIMNVGDARIRILSSTAAGLYVPTHAAVRSASDRSKLVFHRYGNTYFLSAVWIQGNTTGRELSRSRAERELERNKAEVEVAEVRPTK